MRLLLDTSFLIALRRGQRNAQLMLEERKGTADDVGISRLTEYELRLGAQHLWKKYGDARELAWIEELFEWLTIYEVGGDVVRDAADLQAEALGRGGQFPDMDLLIALSGKSGSELLTLDEDQLKMSESLKTKGVTPSTP